MFETIKESFDELFSLINSFISNKSYQKKIKKYSIRIIFFILFFSFIILLSNILRDITFLEGLDLSNPENIPELQPLTDFDTRKIGIIALFTTFSIIGIVVGKWEGFGSILGLILSGYTIYYLIVPLLLNGWSPVWVTLIAGTIVITATIAFSHGFNLKSLSATLGGFISLSFTLIVGEIFIRIIQLSGYYGESTYTLLASSQINYDMQGIVLASVILAGIGLLDDMTITQSSIVKEIILLDENQSILTIFSKAMKVGKDHVGAVINSLFWAYSAASLPLFMLFSLAEVEFGLDFITQQELILEEVFRTFVSSMGLILAIPLTTIIAAIVMKRYSDRLNRDISDKGHSHLH